MNTQKKNLGNTMFMVVGAVALIALITGIFVVANNRSPQTTDSMMEEESATGEITGEDAIVEDEEGMMQDEDAMIEDEESMMGDNAEIIALEGGMYYFDPNEIVVEAGDQVKITLTSVEGMHDFVIEDLDVKSEIAQEGDTVTVSFTPDKVGKFEFYCSVGNHRAQGMVGTLTVTE